MRVQLAPSARAQFLDALEFIRQDDPEAAERLLGRVAEATRHLALHPGLGHEIPGYPNSRHRQIVVRPYRMFYRVDNQTVLIVGIWHGRQVPRDPH